MLVVLGPAEELMAALADHLDGVVVVDAMPTIVDLSAQDWPRLVDDAMWRTLTTLQDARSSMLEVGGRIVLVVPTIGMAGAVGLTAYTTAVEGIRAMAKSAARQWAADGIAVNMIAAPVHLFAAADVVASHLTSAAVHDDTTLIQSVVETAKFLLGSDVDHLVGATIVVDGGSVMLP